MENRKNKYFGTDGFRGEAGAGLTALHAYKIGRFLGWFYASPLSGCMEAVYRVRALIGRDTRLSGDMLENAVCAGLCASGADVYTLGVTTTPSVAYLAWQEGFDFGIMITASHNPFCDNGIKIISRAGEKLCDEVTLLAEAYLDGDVQSLGVQGELPLAKGGRIGRVFGYGEGRARYAEYLRSLASYSYGGLRVGLDTANGAAYQIAKEVFLALGAKVEQIGAEPDGLNINEACGSTHTEKLCALVREKGLSLGFAFDGDGDRCIAADENGNVCDGDKMLYIFAKSLCERGKLAHKTAVATVMSNSGLDAALSREGIELSQTAVGDRFVYERMQKNGFCLGGEQSGHIIFREYATTGDGILAAIMLADEVCRSGKPLSELARPVVLYPQHTVNVRVRDKSAVIRDAAVLAAVKMAEDEIDGKGRVLLRESGTEPLVRVMVECESEEKCREYAKGIAGVIAERGGTHE